MDTTLVIEVIRDVGIGYIIMLSISLVIAFGSMLLLWHAIKGLHRDS